MPEFRDRPYEGRGDHHGQRQSLWRSNKANHVNMARPPLRESAERARTVVNVAQCYVQRHRTANRGVVRWPVYLRTQTRATPRWAGTLCKARSANGTWGRRVGGRWDKQLQARGPHRKLWIFAHGLHVTVQTKKILTFSKRGLSFCNPLASCCHQT